MSSSSSSFFPDPLTLFRSSSLSSSCSSCSCYSSLSAAYSSSFPNYLSLTLPILFPIFFSSSRFPNMLSLPIPYDPIPYLLFLLPAPLTFLLLSHYFDPLLYLLLSLFYFPIPLSHVLYSLLSSSFSSSSSYYYYFPILLSLSRSSSRSSFYLLITLTHSTDQFHYLLLLLTFPSLSHSSDHLHNLLFLSPFFLTSDHSFDPFPDLLFLLLCLLTFLFISLSLPSGPFPHRLLFRILLLFSYSSSLLNFLTLSHSVDSFPDLLLFLLFCLLTFLTFHHAADPLPYLLQFLLLFVLLSHPFLTLPPPSSTSSPCPSLSQLPRRR